MAQRPDELPELAEVVTDLAEVVARLANEADVLAHREGRAEAEALALKARRIAHLDLTDADPADRLVQGPVVEVFPGTPLRTVAEILRGEVVGAVLVRDAEQPLGIVSERDVVWALAGGADLAALTAEDVMSLDVVRADADEPILDVARRMLVSEVRHMPVVAEGRVVGMISARDVLRVLVSTRAGA